MPKFNTSAIPLLPALAVDAACSGNPGVLEFRGVVVESEQALHNAAAPVEAFRRGPFPIGTNNIGEFLALVLGLAWLKANKLDWNLYSDSVTALAWVRNRKAKTNLPRNSQTEELYQMIAKAELWLKQNTYSTRIYKWDTDKWGEVPADYGRK